ncbi:MAG TPA: LLM class F420-dependent oxidoreductase, partial [Mycobacterium sp.]|nr:LLM class F420-dependent oxidoreductase [Mycobacterium sp.]
MQYTVSVAMSPLDDLLEIAKAAEELGFDNIALPDSIFYME